jgi:hypothetical protein
MDKQQKKQIDSWIAGVPYEVAYWETNDRVKARAAGIADEVKFGRKSERGYDKVLCEVAERFPGQTIHALDVGSAITYVLSPPPRTYKTIRNIPPLRLSSI